MDLPAALGVDLLHCERQAHAAVAESGGSLQVVQGELIATSYFDALAGEVADSLQASRPARHMRREANCISPIVPWMACSSC